nr:nucleotide-binding alpha-beta plait domain-containing protein [Tanacetum cinerariifolium]
MGKEYLRAWVENYTHGWVVDEKKITGSYRSKEDDVARISTVGSWFSQIIEASKDFVNNGRIAWVEVEGVPFKMWSHNTFKRIADRWGKILDVDDQEETCYHSKRLCIHTKSGSLDPCMSNDGGAKEHIPGGWGDGNEQEDDLVSGFEEEKQADNNVEEGYVDDQENKSEDPFQIYKLLHKNNKVDRNEGVSDDSLKYPPGFTPHGSNDADSSNVVGNNNATVKVERVNTIYEANEGSGGIRVNGISKANSAESGMSGHFKTSSLPRTWGSILGILDEVVIVGQVMGYNMEGCKSNMADIIGSQGVEEMEGFSKMVEDGWRDSPCDRSNTLRNLTGKLKHLKNNICVWNKTKGNSNRDAKAQLKLELEVVDLCIDNGNWTVEDIKRKWEIVNKLQDIDKLQALETAQKAKVKWAVEGDENSSFFM